MAPEVLLSALEKDFGARVEAARRSLEALPERPVRDGVALSRLDSFVAATDRAVDAISKAQSRVYLSGWTDELKDSPLRWTKHRAAASSSSSCTSVAYLSSPQEGR